MHFNYTSHKLSVTIIQVQKKTIRPRHDSRQLHQHPALLQIYTCIAASPPWINYIHQNLLGHPPLLFLFSLGALNSREDPSGNRLSGNIAAPLLATLGSQVNVDIVAKGVLNDDRAGTVRVEGGNGLDATAAGVGVAASAAEDGGANGDVFAVLCHHVVGSLEGVLAVVDGDETSAGGASTLRQVRAVLGGGAEGPGSNTGSPVLERADGEAGGLVPGAGGGSPALGHVLLHVGELVLEGGQDGPVQVGGIAVPRNGGDIVGGNAQDLLGEIGLV